MTRSIELTRFPVPDDGDHDAIDTEAGLVRAADLIGQLADPMYMRKIAGLFYEFQEIGIAERLGYRSPADIVDYYPEFFWTRIEPFVGPGLRYLELTSSGKRWIANLYSHVFSVGTSSPEPGAACSGDAGWRRMRERWRVDMSGKEHAYATTVEWTGNSGSGTSGYRTYERAHTIVAEGKPVIPGSSDPSFRGDPARYNPEDLLVGSLSACHMLWYSARVFGWRNRGDGISRPGRRRDGRGRLRAVAGSPASRFGRK